MTQRRKKGRTQAKMQKNQMALQSGSNLGGGAKKKRATQVTVSLTSGHAKGKGKMLPKEYVVSWQGGGEKPKKTKRLGARGSKKTKSSQIPDEKGPESRVLKPESTKVKIETGKRGSYSKKINSVVRVRRGIGRR